jgi:hypothetical protein
MSRNGVLRKKPDGCERMERVADVIVLRMGIPFAAFSMIAL